MKKFVLLICLCMCTVSFAIDEKTDPFLKTSKNIRLCIADFLSHLDMVHLSQTCKNWHNTLHKNLHEKDPHSSLYNRKKVQYCFEKGEHLALGEIEDRNKSIQYYKIAFEGGYWPALIKIYELNLPDHQEQKVLMDEMEQSSHLPTQIFFRFWAEERKPYEFDEIEIAKKRVRTFIDFVSKTCEETSSYVYLRIFSNLLCKKYHYFHFVKEEGNFPSFEKIAGEIQEIPQETRKNLMIDLYPFTLEKISFENYMEKYVRSWALSQSLIYLFHGFLGTNNEEKILEYALKSSEYGYHLGMLYLFEQCRKGPPIQEEAAKKWLQKILDLQDAYAFFNIAKMYFDWGPDNCFNIEKDIEYARFFYKEAAKLGLEEAKKKVQNC